MDTNDPDKDADGTRKAHYRKVFNVRKLQNVLLNIKNKLKAKPSASSQQNKQFDDLSSKSQQHIGRLAQRLEAISTSYSNPPQWPLWLGVIAIFIGVVFATLGFNADPFTKKDISSFIKEIGFAFVIAYIITITVEFSARREYNSLVLESNRMFSRNMYEYIYDVNLSEDVFDFVEKFIFKSKFVRIGVKINYTFKEIFESDFELDEKENKIEIIQEIAKNWMFVEVETTYWVKNLTSEVATYPAPLIVEKQINRIASDEILSSRIGLISFFAKDKYFTPDELKYADDKWEDDSRYLRYKFEVDLLPDEVCRISMVYRMVKNKTDSEFWRSLYICDNLQLTASFPREIKLQMDAVLPLAQPPSDSQAETNDGGSTIDADAEAGEKIHYERTLDRAECVIRHPLFPGNGVMMWWQPASEIDPEFLN